MSRVFQIDSGVTAALAGLTITGGSASAGGGMLNLGTITLTDSTVSGNSAISGGGVYNFGTAMLIDSTISGNSAISGGGVYNFGTAKLTDSTISGNFASYGGGVRASGPLTLTACTVSGNSAAVGGGILLLSGPNSRTTIGDTIVAGNTAIISPDLDGKIDQDQGFNLIGDGTGASGFTAASDQLGTAASAIDTLLAPLGDYGGPTQTMALRTGSPAIGRGTTVAGLTADQRGFALDAPRADIGAFQSNPLVVNTTSDVTGSLPGNLNLRQAVNLANVTDGAATITFDPTVFAAHQTLIALTARPARAERRHQRAAGDDHRPGRRTDHRRGWKEPRLPDRRRRDRRALRPDHHRRLGLARLGRRPGKLRYGHADRLHCQRQLPPHSASAAACGTTVRRRSSAAPSAATPPYEGGRR